MSSRLWGLDRRQTIVVFTLVVVVGIVIGLLLGPAGRNEDPAPRGDGTARIDPGSPGSARAVWAFGFETLRFGPALGLHGRLPVQGYGAVQGAAGRVDLYDPASGRTGVLTSTTNRLRSAGRVPAGVAPTAPFAPLIATTATHRWLVPRPGVVLRVGRFSAPDHATVPVAGEVAGPVASAVATAGRAVYAATAGSAGITVARVDAATAKVGSSGQVAVAGPFTLDGLTADRAAVWVLVGGTAYALDPESLTVTRRVTVTGRGPGEVRGLVAAGGGVFTLADNGASLVRVDGTTPVVVLRILPEALPTFRLPASLTASGRRVYALVPRTATVDDRRTRLAGYDVGRGRPTPAVDLPSGLFAGAVAAT